MKRYLVSAFVLVAVVVLPNPIGAAGFEGELERGMRELSFSMLFSAGDSDGFSLQISGEYGFFLTSHHELGPVLSLSYADFDQWGSEYAGSLGLFYRCNLPKINRGLVPFVGARGQWFFGGFLQDYEVRAEVGVRVIAGQWVSLNLTGYYRHIFCSDSCYGDPSRFGAAVGMSLLF